MGAFESHPTTGLRRYAAAIALTTISLAAGVYFQVKGPVTGLPPAGVTVVRIATGSGSQRGIITDTGVASFSGAVKTEAGFSGATLRVDALGGAALNHALCPKAGGVVGYCSSVVGVDGTCTCN